MKRILYTLVIAVITVSFFNCATTYVKKTTDGWKGYELLPSKVKDNGETFYIGKLSDGTTFGAYWDATVSSDGSFYYKRIMQDFGWHKNTEGGWTENYAGSGKRDQYGYIYVNPKKGVGVYFNPKSNGDYKAYKVKLK